MKGHNISATLPTTNDLLNLPLAESGAYQLTDAQIAVLRARIYSINQSHVHGWKWRTTKLRGPKKGNTKPENILHTLIVWRVK